MDYPLFCSPSMHKACTLAAGADQSQEPIRLDLDPDLYWAKPIIERQGQPLAAATLDSFIPPNHMVRLLDEILQALDWTEWEQQYERKMGQPPIQPMVVAAVIIYGLLRRVRSSRQLEYLCNHCLDFIWLAEGRAIDHTTICKFRLKFQRQIKDLFRQVCRLAKGMGLIRLGEIMFDGTRVKANNARHETATAATLEKQLADLEAELERLWQAWEDGDFADEQKFAASEAATQLPKELAEMQARKERLQQALEKAKALDEARRQQGDNKNPAQAPLTDLDCQVMPNKEGGSAPNYTPTVAVDAECGFIVDAMVLGSVSESAEVVPMVARVTETFGEAPQAVVVDAGNASGTSMSQLEEQGVEFFTPVTSSQPQPGDVAYREDPCQPVAPEQWDELPRNPQGRIDKSAFTYDSQNDRYYCPMGETMEFTKSDRRQQAGGMVRYKIYRASASACAGCPLANACVSPKSKGGRSIRRDENEPARERTAARMQTDRGREIYSRRLHVGETPFAVLKAMMNFRQFLVRGLDRVNTEWIWGCTAYDMRKLLNYIEALRAYREASGSQGVSKELSGNN